MTKKELALEITKLWFSQQNKLIDNDPSITLEDFTIDFHTNYNKVLKVIESETPKQKITYSNSRIA